MRETTHCSCDFQVKAVNIFKKNEFILVLNKVLITSHYSSRKPCLERVKFILKIKISDIMSKQKFVVFLIAIIGMIATFLPWYEIARTMSSFAHKYWNERNIRRKCAINKLND